MSRNKLILLAYLLGCDYTEGLEGKTKFFLAFNWLDLLLNSVTLFDVRNRMCECNGGPWHLSW